MYLPYAKKLTEKSTRDTGRDTIAVSNFHSKERSVAMLVPFSPAQVKLAAPILQLRRLLGNALSYETQALHTSAAGCFTVLHV